MLLTDFNRKFAGFLGIGFDTESLTLKSQVYEFGNFREITEPELAEIVIERSSLTLKSEGGSHTVAAPNGTSFTVKDLLDAVELTERATRHKSNWFGGIDTHHVYFEGISERDGKFEINWGS